MKTQSTATELTNEENELLKSISIDEDALWHQVFLFDLQQQIERRESRERYDET